MAKLKLHVTQLPYLDSARLFGSVAHESWAMLFDSGPRSAGGASGRYDIMAIEPRTTLVFDGESTQFQSGKVTQSLYGDPMAILQSAIPECEALTTSMYLPGAYGYFSYDLGRQYEALPALAEDDENLPQMAMGVYYVVLVVDHKRQKCRLIRMGSADHAQALEQRWLDIVVKHQDELLAREIDSIEAQADSTNNNAGNVLSGRNLQQSLAAEDYQQAFSKVRQYTLAGDCYQVNLTKRFSAQVDAEAAWPAYTQLRESSPAPYGCYMNLPFAQVLSNSPESFIKCRSGKVTTRPIKGTRPRNHDNPVADQQIAAGLQNSQKDRAENVMIVDLMRNDLSRACELGSVKVPELFALHSFANVHHLISTVVGTLRKDLHALDLLRRCFPGGSITGAPKIRAMQIIEELEPYRRGLYCGAVGYVGANGDLETNIAIRTLVIKDGVARFSAGGGLVIDSKVDDEHQELIDKVSMLMATVMPQETP